MVEWGLLVAACMIIDRRWSLAVRETYRDGIELLDRVTGQEGLLSSGGGIPK